MAVVTRGDGQMEPRFELVDIGQLKSHEETRMELLTSLVAEIKKDGFLRKPVLVEDKHYVILDGHHRYEALKLIGCRKIPVYLVDYLDEAVYLTTWPEAKHTNLTKDDVLNMAKSGRLYPPKTTRHIVRIKLKEVPVSLKDLM